jgi:hypothetical protein
MTWYYYGAFLSIAFAIIIKERVHVDELFHQQNLTHTYLGGLIITNSVLFLPILNDYNNIIQYLVPVYWLVFYISFVSQSLPSILRFRLRRNVAK